MPYFEQFLTLTTVSLISAMVPGPDFAMVTRNSILYSKKAAMGTVAGVSLGLFVHLSYILLGVGCLIAESQTLMIALKYLGVGYLLFLGVTSLMNPQLIPSTDSTEDEAEHLSFGSAMRMGFFTNVLNVQCILFLISLFTLVITPTMPWFIQVGFGLWRIIVSFFWFVLVVLFFSHPVIKNRFLALGPWFKIIMGLLLCFLAVKSLLAPTPAATCLL